MPTATSGSMAQTATTGLVEGSIVWRAPSARICYVSQEPELDADLVQDTVRATVAALPPELLTE